jgi:ribose-phosphate pyrophosphokinase
MIYLNGSPVNTTLFPDNTSQVWRLPEVLLKETNWFHITWEFQHEGEFMQLAQLKSLIDSYGHSATLKLKYLPYGRQDKYVANNVTFALRTFAKLLNTLQFKNVIIHDPHSSVATELIHNSSAVYPVEEVMKIAFDLKVDLFCYPDNGAVVKYTGGGDVQKEIYDYPCTYGEKVRDQLTGQITSYKLIGEVRNKNVLIVDDICDYGRTFILLAEKLKEAGAKEINLFVTHGLFSGGLKVIKDSGISRIFTAEGEATEHSTGHIQYETI